MMKYSLLAILGLSAFSLALDTALGMGNQEVSVITNCTGVQVIRVSVGQFEIRHVEPNLPGCVNTTRIQTTTPVVLNVNTASTGTVLVNTGMTNTGITNSGSVIPHVVTNCNGTQILTLSGGTYAITHTGSNLPGCISSTAT